MSQVSSSDEEGINGINVTPLVDITLVLLIVFIVTAKLITGQSIPVDLPKAASANTTQTMFTVTIDPQGHVFADGQAAKDDAELRERARRALAQNPELRTVIQASARASHGTVMHVVDEVREVGIAKMAFAVDRKGE
jgi:biopolymer transport protein ExbD